MQFLPSIPAVHMQRIRTAACVIVPLLAALWAGGAYLLALAIMICAMAQWEFYSMFWRDTHRIFKIIGTVLGATVLISVFLQEPSFTLALLGASFLLSALLFLANWGRGTEVFDAPESFVLVCGILYIPFLLGFAGYFSPFEQLLLIATAALSDTTAYFVGVQYGRRKIWPSVSPKKSVEGSIGGLCASVVVCSVAGIWGTATWWLFPLVGIYLGIAAQLGDFFESALKRSCSVKDSGGLLPGHGGILDRIDSLLFVVPAYMALSALIPLFRRIALP